MCWSSELNSPIQVYFSLLIFKMLMFTLPSPIWPLPIWFQGPNIPGSNAILLFTASDLFPSSVTPTFGCCFCFLSISSFFQELFLHWSPVEYWAPTDLGSSSFSILSFCLFLLFMGFSSQNCWSDLCHSLPWWTAFCQNSPSWPVCLEWPYTSCPVIHGVIQGCGQCDQIA